MNRKRNGIAIEPLVSKAKAKKATATKASTDAGKLHIADVPKYLFELVKQHEDGTEETVFTPSAQEMKQLEREGYTYVATHETKQPVYQEGEY